MSSYANSYNKYWKKKNGSWSRSEGAARGQSLRAGGGRGESPTASPMTLRSLPPRLTLCCEVCNPGSVNSNQRACNQLAGAPPLPSYSTAVSGDAKNHPIAKEIAKMMYSICLTPTALESRQQAGRFIQALRTVNSQTDMTECIDETLKAFQAHGVVPIY